MLQYVKTKKILSMKVTDEHVHDDSKALPELVDEAIKSDNMLLAATIGKLFADGAYDNNDIFRYLGDNGYALYQSKKEFELDGEKKKTSLEIYQF